MSLRSKIMIILAVLAAILVGLNYAVQAFIVWPNFAALERDEAQKDMNRVLEALRNEIQYLDLLCHDWASWDDTYRFVISPNRAYTDANLVDESLIDNRLNALYIINHKSEVVWGRTIDLKTKKEIHLPSLPTSDWSSSHFLLRHDSLAKGITGVVNTAKGPMMVASRPILTSQNRGPSRGSLIMGRFLGAEVVAGLSKRTRVAFEIAALASANLPESERFALTRNREAQRLVFRPVNDELLEVYAAFPTLDGAPPLLIKADIPRRITAKGRRAARIATLAVVAVAAVAVIIVVVLIQSLVLKPIKTLTDHVVAIGRSDDLSARLALKRSDEIGALAREFDNMVIQLFQARQKLVEMSYLDWLTGVPNRRYFDEVLLREWKRAAREARPISLVMIDVDRFKEFNDTYGHQAGDECLIKVAKAFGGALHRPVDFVARYGGEEFVALLPNTDLEGALSVSREVQTAIKELAIPHESSEVDPYVTVSLGVTSVIPTEQIQPTALVTMADNALYQAKRRGRNQIVWAGQYEGRPMPENGEREE